MRTLWSAWMVVLCVAGCEKGAAWDHAALSNSTGVLHVSTQGRDDWSGTLPEPAPDGSDGPLATLTGARNRIRVLRAANDGAPSQVLVHGGLYRLRTAFVLESQDSGEPGNPVIYEAAPGERPRFSGGEPLRGFTVEDGVWTLSRPELREGARREWRFSQLYVNGRRSIRARAPNAAAYTEASSHAGYFQRLPSSEPPQAQRFRIYVEPAAMAILAALPPAALRDVELGTFDQWIAPRNYIASIDPATNLVVLGGKFPWHPSLTPPEHSRIELLNVPTALDAPGEHYLDRSTGTLRYVPFPGEDPATAEVIAPRSATPELVHLRADPDEPVHDVVLRGLVLEHAPYEMRRTWLDDDKFTGGMNDSQGIFSAPAALTIENGVDVELDALEIRRTGATAIWIRGTASERVHVHDSFLHELGGSGVTVAEYHPRVSYSLGRTNVGSVIPVRGRHLVEDNVIHEGGRELYQAPGINVCMAAHNVVRRNDIADFSWDGIQFATFRIGAVPDIDASHDNLIAQNRVHRIGLDLMSDLAGIYFFSGPMPGTVVEGNEVSIVRHHHVGWSYGGYLASGIYLDGGSNYVTVENNVVYDTESAGLWMNEGRGRVIQNNVFADVDEGGWGTHFVSCPACPGPPTFIENNVFEYRRGAGTITSNAAELIIEADHNLYFQRDGRPVTFFDQAYGHRTFAEWQALGFDPASIVTDPLFADPDTTDFTPTADLAAIGFIPFVLEAGVSAGSASAIHANRYDGALDFGGMYGGGEAPYGNPAYGGIAACPPGYTDTRVLGTLNVDHALGFCHRPLDADRPPLLDFGGMYGVVDGVVAVNPLTGAASCPSGYTATRVLGALGVDYALHVCQRPHVPGTPPRLAGMFGGFRDAELGATYWPNPAARNRPVCPDGSTRHEVLGTLGADYPLFYCLTEEP